MKAKFIDLRENYQNAVLTQLAVQIDHLDKVTCGYMITHLIHPCLLKLW